MCISLYFSWQIYLGSTWNPNLTVGFSTSFNPYCCVRASIQKSSKFFSKVACIFFSFFICLVRCVFVFRLNPTSGNDIGILSAVLISSLQNFYWFVLSPHHPPSLHFIMCCLHWFCNRIRMNSIYFQVKKIIFIFRWRRKIMYLLLILSSEQLTIYDERVKE